MYIHRPEKDLSITENFLRLLRPDTKFTELEARVLDIALLLHMEPVSYTHLDVYKRQAYNFERHHPSFMMPLRASTIPFCHK